MAHEDGELSGNAAENLSAKSTDVLIIGAGPTGLMMVCQLLRFGVSFRIIDRKKDRALESRAFAIQAKSMEIFQNLGISSKFLKVARTGMEFAFFINGKKQVAINFAKFPQQNTPFLSIYFLPQSEAEHILTEFLAKKNNFIEREKELITFSQDKNGVTTKIKNCLNGETEEICYAYIKGPHAGQRAPDAPIKTSSLFCMLQEKPFHLLLLHRDKTQRADLERLKLLADIHADWVQILHFQCLARQRGTLPTLWCYFSRHLYYQTRWLYRIPLLWL